MDVELVSEGFLEGATDPMEPLPEKETIIAKETPNNPVKKILDRRTRYGKLEYLIQTQNTGIAWEREDNLSCIELITSFEAMRKKRESKEEKRKARANPQKNNLEEIKKPRGYDRQLKLEKIIGATTRDDTLMFLVKWHSSNELDLIPAKEVNIKDPAIVIAFYESRSSIYKMFAKRQNIVAEANMKIAARKPTSIEESAVEVALQMETSDSVIQVDQPDTLDSVIHVDQPDTLDSVIHVDQPDTSDSVIHVDQPDTSDSVIHVDQPDNAVQIPQDDTTTEDIFSRFLVESAKQELQSDILTCEDPK